MKEDQDTPKFFYLVKKTGLRKEFFTLKSAKYSAKKEAGPFISIYCIESGNLILEIEVSNPSI